MQTSNYKTVERLGLKGAIAASRSLYPPERRNLYPTYRLLAPGPWFKDWREKPDNPEKYHEYCILFAAQLSKLDPQVVWADLHKLAAEPIICCYEPIPASLATVQARSLPPKNFCHRRLVAEWFEEQLGVSVPEIIAPEETMLTICKRSGLEFDAPSKRYKQHPKISEWLQKANREGWYDACVDAIASMRSTGASSIEEFEQELTIVCKAAIEAKEARDAEQQAYWKAVNAAAKERRSQKARLRAAGYHWHNCAYNVDDPDTADWQLLSPDGRSVSVEEALKEIGN